MNMHCKNLIFNVTFWLATEILLTVTGLDSLADYSEFLFKDHSTIKIQQPIAGYTLLQTSPNHPLQFS
ncbi:MAG TPA: hypothetical protein V6C84_17030 [Coleofasciculaceae cyanobacterium]